MFHAASGEGAGCAFFVNDDTYDFDGCSRLEQFEDAFGVGHLAERPRERRS